MAYHSPRTGIFTQSVNLVIYTARSPTGRFKNAKKRPDFVITPNEYMNNLIHYLKETRAELAHVSWPTQRQVISYTIAVFVVSALVAIILGLFDYIFSKALSFIIG
jgi:preprotein translocase subunit SecE